MTSFEVPVFLTKQLLHRLNQLLRSIAHLLDQLLEGCQLCGTITYSPASRSACLSHRTGYRCPGTCPRDCIRCVSRLLFLGFVLAVCSRGHRGLATGVPTGAHTWSSHPHKSHALLRPQLPSLSASQLEVVLVSGGMGLVVRRLAGGLAGKLLGRLV